MYHVLIVCENRILLKQVYDMVEKEELLCIHVAPYSMDAYESFYKNHADIVIMDTSVFLPYESLLERFSQCNWRYYVILLANSPSSLPLSENVFSISKASLTKELFDDILCKIIKYKADSHRENTICHFEWHGVHKLTLHPDTYHLVYLRWYSPDTCDFKEKVLEFLTLTEPYFHLTPILSNEHSMLCYISRSKIHRPYTSALLSNMVHQVFPSAPSILYDKNVSWKRFEDACNELHALHHYHYFLRGEFALVSDCVPKPILITELSTQCGMVFQAILENDRFKVNHMLRELYLHKVKDSLNVASLAYVRMQMKFFHWLVLDKAYVIAADSLEEEFKLLLASPLFSGISYHSERVKESVNSAALLLYQNYRKEISLEDIAKMLNLNKTYLNRIFKEQFHVTILDALLSLRMLHAKYYLVYTEEKVSEIARLCGFHDNGYFSKYFKKMTGDTAMEYRLNIRNRKEASSFYEGLIKI